ncbi:hypothetical protein B0H11DRAFT_2263119 [Mycena galericulata]|nr:hypothetical protein B0H11DRAFT_2263119 [Mycena galericulata]
MYISAPEFILARIVFLATVSLSAFIKVSWIPSSHPSSASSTRCPQRPPRLSPPADACNLFLIAITVSASLRSDWFGARNDRRRRASLCCSLALMRSRTRSMRANSCPVLRVRPHSASFCRLGDETY